MQAFEFQSQLGPDKQLPIPGDLVGSIPSDRSVRVIVLVPEQDEEREWIRFGNEQFLKGYAESDAIYDQFSTRRDPPR